MKSPKAWMKRRPVPVITVSWLEDRITFVSWEPPVSRQGIIRRTLGMEGRECTPESYRKALREVAGAGDGERAAVYWVVLQEAFPPILDRVGKLADFPVKLPDWTIWCWQSLTAADLPRAIISGMAAMERELMQWSPFTEPGTGYCLSIDGHNLFLGQGNGHSVRRVSRRMGLPEAGPDAVSGDWLLQTRTLYRNRTGLELKRVFVEEEAGYAASWMDGIPFEIIPARKPQGIVSPRDCPLSAAMIFLHRSVVSIKSEKACQLVFRSVRRRVQYRLWERRLRLVAGLLFCGWGFLLLNACQHEVLLPSIREATDPEVESARDRLIESEKRWRHWRRHKYDQETPMHLLGLVAESVPEGVEVDRFRVERVDDPGRESVSLEMEGFFRGREPSGTFREWFDLLRGSEALESVDNLRFRRSDGDIAFTFTGTASAKEGAP